MDSPDAERRAAHERPVGFGSGVVRRGRVVDRLGDRSALVVIRRDAERRLRRGADLQGARIIIKMWAAASKPCFCQLMHSVKPPGKAKILERRHWRRRMCWHHLPCSFFERFQGGNRGARMARHSHQRVGWRSRHGTSLPRALQGTGRASPVLARHPRGLAPGTAPALHRR